MKNLIWAALSGFLLFVLSCGKKQDDIRELKKVSVGLQNNCASAMFLIAKANGYFKKQGLDVDFKFYPSGSRQRPQLGNYVQSREMGVESDYLRQN